MWPLVHPFRVPLFPPPHQVVSSKWLGLSSCHQAQKSPWGGNHTHLLFLQKCEGKDHLPESLCQLHVPWAILIYFLILLTEKMRLEGPRSTLRVIPTRFANFLVHLLCARPCAESGGY